MNGLRQITHGEPIAPRKRTQTRLRAFGPRKSHPGRTGLWMRLVRVAGTGNTLHFLRDKGVITFCRSLVRQDISRENELHDNIMPIMVAKLRLGG